MIHKSKEEVMLFSVVVVEGLGLKPDWKDDNISFSKVIECILTFVII